MCRPNHWQRNMPISTKESSARKIIPRISTLAKDKKSAVAVKWKPSSIRKNISKMKSRIPNTWQCPKRKACAACRIDKQPWAPTSSELTQTQNKSCICQETLWVSTWAATSAGPSRKTKWPNLSPSYWASTTQTIVFRTTRILSEGCDATISGNYSLKIGTAINDWCTVDNHYLKIAFVIIVFVHSRNTKWKKKMRLQDKCEP